MNPTNEKELRELDDLIAEKVMLWKRTERPDDWTDTDETLFWHRPLDPELSVRSEIVVVGRAYRRRTSEKFSHSWSRWQPTSSNADAMMVLEKCAVGSPFTHITKLGDKWIIFKGSDAEFSNRVEADTLPLAISRFSKQLFTSPEASELG